MKVQKKGLTMIICNPIFALLLSKTRKSFI